MAKIKMQPLDAETVILEECFADYMAKGFSLYESVSKAKAYITGALSAMLDLGQGSGPMNHAFDLHSRFTEEKEISV